jgi:hypothetical protein
MHGVELPGYCVTGVVKVVGTLAGGTLQDSWILLSTTMLPHRTLPLSVDEIIVMSQTWEVQHGIYPLEGTTMLVGAMATQGTHR